MKLRTKLLLWFVGIIFISVVFSAIQTKRFLRFSGENQRLNMVVIPAIDSSQELITQFLHWVRGIEELGNGYLTKKEFQELEASAKQSITQEMQSLKFFHETIGVDFLQKIERSYREVEGISAAVLMTPGPKGRLYLEGLDGIVSNLELLQKQQKKLHLQTIQDAVESDQRLEKLVMLTWILLLAVFSSLLFLMNAWIGRTIIHPLEVLEKATHTAGEGEFDPPQIYLGASGCIGLLFRSFYAMAAKMRVIITRVNDDNVKLNAILDHLPEGITIRDMNYNLLYHNHLVKKGFGNVVGQVCHKVFEGRDTVCEGCPVELSKKDGESHVLIKETLFPDGSNHIFENTATPIKNAHGEVVSFLEVNRDITDEVREQKEKEEMQKQIFHTERLASIGLLAAGVGHEINNPLTVITGAIHLIQQGSLVQGEKEKKKLQQIERAALRIGEIVNGLRVFARKDSVTLAPQDIHEVLRETMSMVTNMFASDDVKVTLVEEAKNVHVLANGNHLQQIFINLLSNARDAIKDTGKGIGGEIKIKTFNEDKFLLIKISDTGPGIVPEVRAKIFDMFFTTKEPGKGTGMGLGIVQKLVKDMGGNISLAPQEEGVGATFHISLPWCESASHVSNLAADQNIRFTGRVLLVDDEPDVLEVTREMLLGLGLEVSIAHDGFSAFEMIQKNQFDYLITDLKMKNMTGEELIAKVRALKGSAPHIVAMTGGECNVVTDAKILKPFVRKDLEKVFTSLANARG